MQIEPPETIHFPIHSLQELQEQRGGLRVSALGKQKDWAKETKEVAVLAKAAKPYMVLGRVL